jgi:hypothetical protein
MFAWYTYRRSHAWMHPLSPLPSSKADNTHTHTHIHKPTYLLCDLLQLTTSHWHTHTHVHIHQHTHIFKHTHTQTQYFLSHLLKLITSPNHTDTMLLAGSCYLGSFLARAGFARLPITATTLRLLSTWVHEYIDAHDSDADPIMHSHFYSVVQSFFYCLCFKLRPLLDDTKCETLVKLELRLERLVSCKLNPLKVLLCLCVCWCVWIHILWLLDDTKCETLVKLELQRRAGGVWIESLEGVHLYIHVHIHMYTFVGEVGAAFGKTCCT